MDVVSGLWIDHERAVIAFLSGGEEKVVLVRSHMKGSHQDASAMAAGGTAHDDHARGYFDEVISYLRKADAIFVFGPGRAKTDMLRRMKYTNIEDRVKKVETTPRMSLAQVLARVRRHALPQ